jgi:aminopeptidase-like protein
VKPEAVNAAGGMESTGDVMHALIRELYPICRSITGDGVRQTLERLKADVPLSVREVASGTEVLDWTVPAEWNIRDAYIRNSQGERVVDFREHSLHVMSYSVPVHTRMSLEELVPHLHTLPDRPDWIPYRTSYYREAWGFCLTERQKQRLSEGTYEVCIDSTLAPGSLTYGELLIEGASRDEVLISVHCCHPSLANDNLSGVALAVALAKHLKARRNRYSYRFVFVPASIGPIVWLAENPNASTAIRHGLVLACVGDAGNVTYKRSQQGNAEVDRAAAHVLKLSGAPHRIDDFVPYGYDERQYCSPGFDLPVGRLTRTPNGEFPEYHTSADDPEFVKPESLADSLAVCISILDVLERNCRYVNLAPYGEPQLGRRGLYRGLAGGNALPASELALLWVLNQSDGTRSLLDIAERAGMAFDAIADAADRLEQAGLLRTVQEDDTEDKGVRESSYTQHEGVRLHG